MTTTNGADLLDLENTQSNNWLENNDVTPQDDFGIKAYQPPDNGIVPESSTAGVSPPIPTTIPANYEGGIFSVNHYRRYFDLNTTDFTKNVVGSLNVIKHAKVTASVDTPADIPTDLFGPLWVSATVIFVLFFSNTSSNLLVGWLSGSEEGKYAYDFRLLTGALSLVYGYTFLVPLVFYIVATWGFKLEAFLSLTTIVSVYGYANAAWLPAALLSILRGILVNHSALSAALKWVCVIIGGLISGVSILGRIYPGVKNSCLVLGREKLALGLITSLGLAHLGFVIAVKVLFFGDLNVVN